MDKQDRLIDKVEKEFNIFRWEMKSQSKGQIFNNACQIMIKADFKGYIESEPLPERQLNILLAQENTLDSLYMNWQKLDLFHSEDIKALLWYTCALEEINQEKNQNEETEDDYEI